MTAYVRQGSMHAALQSLSKLSDRSRPVLAAKRLRSSEGKYPRSNSMMTFRLDHILYRLSGLPLTFDNSSRQNVRAKDTRTHQAGH